MQIFSSLGAVTSHPHGLDASLGKAPLDIKIGFRDFVSVIRDAKIRR
jgi:hypothetical protein